MGKAPVIKSALAVAIVYLVTMASCSSTGCVDNQSSLPMAKFYSMQTKAAISLSAVEVYGVGAPNGSVLYKSGDALDLVYLPFRNSVDQTSYVFHYTQDGIDSEEYNDTLTFTYLSKPYFASEECGAMYQYDISKLEYTRHLIDSVAITDSLISNTDVERIQIYFRTSS